MSYDYKACCNCDTCLKTCTFDASPKIRNKMCIRDRGKENALLLYNSGLSVIFAAAGQSGLGVIDAAVAQGKFVIGVDSDQAEALKDSKPEMANVVITSAIKNIPENAVKAVDRAMKGEIPYGTREVFGIAEGAVGIAENEFYEKLLSEEDRKQVELSLIHI